MISKVAPALTTAAALLLAAGCTRPTTKAPAPPAEKKEAHEEHGHVHGEGPHGGTIVDWGGGKYHVEFTVDHKKQAAVVYILGSDEKTPTPIGAKDDSVLLSIKEPMFQVTLKAEPQEGDPAGKSSRFSGTHEKLGKEQEFAGTISGVINGKPYADDFAEEPEPEKKK